MRDRSILLNLAACAVVGLLFILAAYLWFGGNPSNRLGYGLTMSLVPALVSVLLTRLGRQSWTWPKTTATYVVLFSLTILIQALARKL